MTGSIMTCNLGGIERGIRIGLGVALILLGSLLGIYGAISNWTGLLVDGVGVIALLTGAIGWYPVWNLLGINTCERSSKGNL